MPPKECSAASHSQMTKAEAARQLAVIAAEISLAIDPNEADAPTWAAQLDLIADALDNNGPSMFSVRKQLEEIRTLREKVGQAQRRMQAILDTIYSAHGYGVDGEIDTAAKFRAIERLARLDWDDEGMPR